MNWTSLLEEARHAPQAALIKLVVKLQSDDPLRSRACSRAIAKPDLHQKDVESLGEFLRGETHDAPPLIDEQAAALVEALDGELQAIDPTTNAAPTIVA